MVGLQLNFDHLGLVVIESEEEQKGGIEPKGGKGVFFDASFKRQNIFVEHKRTAAHCGSFGGTLRAHLRARLIAWW